MKVSGDWISAPATQSVCTALTKSGYHALFVGGCVRNALLGVPVGDIDIATDALPQEVIRLAADAGLKPVPTGFDHGTITVVSNGKPHEVTTFREDIDTFGRHAHVAFGTDLHADARRRDFTMNALYARADGTVIDPLRGINDLIERRVRFIGDGETRIKEDYLRILRFFRFHAQYGDPKAGIDADALAACAAHLDGLDRLSRERVGAEMCKLLAAADPAPSVAAMQMTGVLNAILPGADIQALAPLVHLESGTNTAPSALRRLSALGGEDIPDRLRLSRAETRRLKLLRDGASAAMPPAEIGYRYGATDGIDMLLLRAALLDAPLDPNALDDLERGANAAFPVKPSDLMPDYTGPALGQRLQELEDRWIASGFKLGREHLL